MGRMLDAVMPVALHGGRQDAFGVPSIGTIDPDVQAIAKHLRARDVARARELVERLARRRHHDLEERAGKTGSQPAWLVEREDLALVQQGDP